MRLLEKTILSKRFIDCKRLMKIKTMAVECEVFKITLLYIVVRKKIVKQCVLNVYVPPLSYHEHFSLHVFKNKQDYIDDLNLLPI